ncbi:MAG: hypothetical protein JNL32_01120 [Candidatus Kapabacteria bacterium]|nr:hypothetical protein [Candidatus Kapabacteria bacterium]
MSTVILLFLQCLVLTATSVAFVQPSRLCTVTLELTPPYCQPCIARLLDIRKQTHGRLALYTRISIATNSLKIQKKLAELALDTTVFIKTKINRSLNSTQAVLSYYEKSKKVSKRFDINTNCNQLLGTLDSVIKQRDALSLDTVRPPVLLEKKSIPIPLPPLEKLMPLPHGRGLYYLDKKLVLHRWYGSTLRHDSVNLNKLIPDSLHRTLFSPGETVFYADTIAEFSFYHTTTFVDTIISGEYARLYKGGNMWRIQIGFPSDGKPVSTPCTVVPPSITHQYIWTKEQDGTTLCVPYPQEGYRTTPTSFSIARCNGNGDVLSILADSVLLHFFPATNRKTDSYNRTVYVAANSSVDWMKISDDKSQIHLPHCSPNHRYSELISLQIVAPHILLTYETEDEQDRISVITNLNGVVSSPYFKHSSGTSLFLLQENEDVQLLKVSTNKNTPTELSLYRLAALLSLLP